jgi:hypothetical protein
VRSRNYRLSEDRSFGRFRSAIVTTPVGQPRGTFGLERCGCGKIYRLLDRLVFAVPLKPRATARDWSAVEEALRRTVTSARAAAGVEGAEIVIAGHERPDLKEADGADVTTLVVPFDVPSTSGEAKRDKARKRRFVGAWLRRRHDPASSVWVVFLDADDLLHRDLGTFLRASDAPSCVIEDGYVYASDRGLLIRYPTGFNRTCGSTFACRFTHTELPDAWDDERAPFSQFGSTPEQRGHQDYDTVATEIGKPPITVPFPAAVYVANHADSLWLSKGRAVRRASNPRTILRPRNARSILTNDFAAPKWAATVAGSTRTFRTRAQTALSMALAKTALAPPIRSQESRSHGALTSSRSSSRLSCWNRQEYPARRRSGFAISAKLMRVMLILSVAIWVVTAVVVGDLDVF